MIARLAGRLAALEDGACILDVNGVGYLVHASSRTLAVLPAAPGIATLLVETQVREDAILLYGFADSAERDWFRLLTTVQGVGGKVALGILSAVSRLRLPLEVDCWLALAQNHISPRAYKQNDVVTALNGTTIEVVHTDAEGRMVLADALTLASRGQPELILDFATLTGSMHTALGSRYSGVFATDGSLAQIAVGAGEVSGERVVTFPLAPDYDPALDSKIADVKQCTADGTADHILAARFLSRFRGGGALAAHGPVRFEQRGGAGSRGVGRDGLRGALGRAVSGQLDQIYFIMPSSMEKLYKSGLSSPFFICSRCWRSWSGWMLQD